MRRRARRGASRGCESTTPARSCLEFGVWSSESGGSGFAVAFRRYSKPELQTPNCCPSRAAHHREINLRVAISIVAPRKRVGRSVPERGGEGRLAGAARDL